MAWPVPHAGNVSSWRPVSVPVSSSTAGSSAAGWTPVASSSVSTAPAAAACADSSGPAPCPPAVKSASAGATASPLTPASAAETPSDREPVPPRATERIASPAAPLSVVGPCRAAGRAVVTTANGVPSSSPRSSSTAATCAVSRSGGEMTARLSSTTATVLRAAGTGVDESGATGPSPPSRAKAVAGTVTPV